MELDDLIKLIKRLGSPPCSDNRGPCPLLEQCSGKKVNGEWHPPLTCFAFRAWTPEGRYGAKGGRFTRGTDLKTWDEGFKRDK